MATKKTKKSKKAVKKAPKTKKQTPVIAPAPPEIDLDETEVEVSDYEDRGLDDCFVDYFEDDDGFDFYEEDDEL